MKPLDSIKVLELSFYLPGPLAGLMLRDLGADVVKIESPKSLDPLRMLGGDFSSRGGRAFKSFNRGKRSCRIDLKDGDGIEAFRFLVKKADVLIVSMRPSTIVRLGIDYDSMRRVNPDIVYCSLTGYGLKGPMADKGGHDLTYQTLAGIVHLARDSEGNVTFPPVPMADIFGTFHTVTAVLAALMERGKTGKGQCVDIAMMQSVLSSNLLNMCLTDVPGETYASKGKMLTGRYAFYNAYASKDGKWFVLGAIEQKFWQRFCEVVEREDLKGRQFDTTAIEDLRKVFGEKSSDWWTRVSNEEDICLEPVIGLEEVLSHPQHEAAGTFSRQTDEILSFGFFPYDPEAGSLAAPLAGENTADVLKDYDVPQSLIDSLLAKK
ncbi:MAG: CaiB/BaiF CoA-transferase family protein [Pseudomonadota bacterium]